MIGEQPLGSAGTVFRAFEASEFLEWPAWRRLAKVLASNGGSYGVSGPRGAGKSWLMLRAIDDARGGNETTPNGGGRPGVGLWYPSPSEYDPLAFLASLSDSLANEIERRFRRRHRLVESAGRIVGFGAPLVLTAVLFAVLSRTQSTGYAATVAVVAGVVAWVTIRLAHAVWRALLPEARLLREAQRVRERARFTATRREASELGAEGGRGLVGRVRTSRERELVERPATLSSLVNDFRALVGEAGQVTGRVVTAIDELDKMADAEKVRALLRDIKGIFEVPRVHFLVSVSDEAARSLNLGALAGRDEFNSSFYTVLELPPATPEECAELLERRGAVPRDVAIALAVLAGGNPREVLRLAELAADAPTAHDAVLAVIRSEALRLRREIVTAPAAGADVLGQEARINAFTSLPDEAFASPATLVELAARALIDELWAPGWADDAWRAFFEEPWCRLLLRIAVAAELAEAPNLVQYPDVARMLQDVVVAAAQSARVGRIVFEERLRLDARPEEEAGMERAALDVLVEQYEAAQATKSPGPARTRELEEVVAAARAATRSAQYASSDIARLLASGRSGERIVGLAAVQATGDAELLGAVLDAVANPHSSFEQYHALLALESLRAGLDDADRRRVTEVVQGVGSSLDEGDRRRLAERILKGLVSEGLRTTPA